MTITERIGLTGVPSAVQVAWSRAASLLEHRPQDPAPGDWQSRLATYLWYDSNALAAAHNLQLMAEMGTPPRLLDAVWSWPTVVRANRKFVDASQQALIALHQIAMVGDRMVFDAALTVAEEVADLCARYRADSGGREPPSDFVNQVQNVDEALAQFEAAVRKDLHQHP